MVPQRRSEMNVGGNTAARLSKYNDQTVSARAKTNKQGFGVFERPTLQRTMAYHAQRSRPTHMGRVSASQAPDACTRLRTRPGRVRSWTIWPRRYLGRRMVARAVVAATRARRQRRLIPTLDRGDGSVSSSAKIAHTVAGEDKSWRRRRQHSLDRGVRKITWSTT